MKQWYEKQKEKFTQTENDPKLTHQVTRLLDRLTGDFKSTLAGKEILALLNELQIRLLEAEKNSKVNKNWLRQETQNFQSFLKVSTLELNRQLLVLKKQFQQQRQQGGSLRQIDRYIQAIDTLSNQINEIEFSKLCRAYGKLYTAYEKLQIKIQTKKNKVTEKPVITSLSSDQMLEQTKKQEAIDRLSNKLNEFRKSLDFLIAHLESSPFKTLNVSADILSVLNGLKDRLSENTVNFDTFTEQSLIQEKQGLNSFLMTQSKELQKQLREKIQDLRSQRTRGFCSIEIDHWIKEVEQLIHQEEIKFPILCDEYAKLHQSYGALILKINDQAQLEYNQFLKKVAGLKIGTKCQSVKDTSFLTDFEKEDFLRMAESIQAEFKQVTLDSIQSGDANKQIIHSNFEETYFALTGKGSLLDRRMQFCHRFQTILQQEGSILSDDTQSQFLQSIQQTLLSGGEPVLESLKKRSHPLMKLAQIVRQVDCNIDNLQQCNRAYEKFIRQHPLNPRHTKKGIEHAKQVIPSDILEMQVLINTQLSNLFNQVNERDGVLTEKDVQSFSNQLGKTYLQWQRMTLTHVAEKSGDNRHSLNNYIKFWMDYSKEHPFTRLEVDQINQEINKQKNPIEFFFSFFSSNKTRFSRHNLRTFISDTIQKAENFEEDPTRQNSWKQEVR